MLTSRIILQSVIKLFQMVTEIQARNEVKYGSGDIVSERGQDELSFVHVTLHIKLFCNPIKYH